MSNLPQSDLILAGRFVDGDLSAQETARTRDRIESDADFAAAVAQIQKQSELLGSLPSFRPASDLADRTLQASLDQVKAIMGAWPIESETEKTTVARESSAQSFDWKSTAALVASLAGVLLIGGMLMQGNTGQSAGVNQVASAPPEKPGVGQPMDSSLAGAAALESDAEELSEMVAAKGVAAVERRRSAEAPDARDSVALSGTPMKPSRSSGSETSPEVSASPATFDQIWCVKQDKAVARNQVSEILQRNQIAVQRESSTGEATGEALPTPTARALADPAVEAFHVAATPKQMKLAMSQISSHADIEMIQLPTGNSPIADAIELQYARSSVLSEADSTEDSDAAKPEASSFAARSQALAQQLVCNALPRSLPLPGPVPPIVSSGAPLKEPPAASPAEKQDGVPGGGQAARLKQQSASRQSASRNESASPNESEVLGAAANAQQLRLDRFLDDSDKQLRQYLILVRGGDGSDK